MPWDKMPVGLAKDIAIDVKGGIWVIGTNMVAPGDFGIFTWDENGQSWDPVPHAGGVRIAAGSQVVVVNSVNDIYLLEAHGWQLLPGKAIDVSAVRPRSAQRDQISVIGTNPVPGGFGVHHWDHQSNNWIGMPGAGGVAISGGYASWVVNDRDDLAVLDGRVWTPRPGKAKDVAADYGNIWAIGTNPVPGGFGIYHWDPANRNWILEPGVGAVRIAVGGGVFKGPCVVNDQGEIFRLL